MKIILFGATGMVGQGVLRECVADAGIERVLSVGRGKLDLDHPKLRQIVHQDLLDLSAIADDLAGYDACFYCLGVSAAGMKEAAYRQVTLDIAVAVARTLIEKSPRLKLCFVSGGGADRNSRAMWARVKAETEDALIAMPFAAATMFRPGFIQPLHGIRSRTRLYRAFYAVSGPLFPLWRVLFPRYVTTTEELARAMIAVAKHGAPEQVLENAGIVAVARRKLLPSLPSSNP